ncbi:DMT family transporter [Arsenicicoccus dermatophilus]|uniref:DMT family transporter n=1 Tax=Arsenicicoccus dermatophilus TaxID=1076331 RepID=UPI0039171E47
MTSVVLLAVAATFVFAMSTVLKHRSAETMAPTSEGRGVRRAGSYVVAMVSNPWWLGGLLCDGGAIVLQVLALNKGAISVVQPMLTLALVFSLVLNALLLRQRPSGREIGLALALVAGLVLFLWASGAVGPHGPAAKGAKIPAIAVGVVATVLVAGCVTVARRVGPRRKAALLGTAVAAVFACTAALIKTCTHIVERGVPDLLMSWQLWTLLVVGGLGLVLNQMAFQAGPLVSSLPVIASLDPLFSLAIGRAVYDERLNSAPKDLVLEGIGLTILLGSVFALSVISARHQQEEQDEAALAESARNADPGGATCATRA